MRETRTEGWKKGKERQGRERLREKERRENERRGGQRVMVRKGGRGETGKRGRKGGMKSKIHGGVRIKGGERRERHRKEG